jgi:peptidoglycan hydrolase-like protein with peptidoglycan-binding domain
VHHCRSTLAALAGAALLGGCVARPAPEPVAPAPAVYEAPAVPGRNLVHAVQIELIRIGYLGGPPDGVLGPHTSAAISRFERANRLPVDGTPSRPLLRRLRATASAGGQWVGPAQAGEPPAGGWVSPSTPGGTGAAPANPPPANPSGGNWVAPAAPPAGNNQ